MKGVVLPLTITLAVQALTSMAMIAPAVMAPVVAPELGVSPQGIGWFVALEYLFGMLSGLVCGALIGRFGPVRACQISVCLAAAGLVAGAGAVLPAVFAAAALIGSGYGLVNPASSHILARSAPPGMMSLIFSIKQTGVPLGGALAGALVPPLILYLGWRWSAAVVALLCLSLALLIQLARIAEHRGAGIGASVSFWAPLGMVFANPPVLELAIVSMIFGSAQLALIAYFVSYLNLELGYSLVVAGLIYSCAHAAGIVGRIFWGAVADRFSPRPTLGLLGVLMALSGAAAAGLSADWPLPLVILVSALFGASAVGWNGVYLAEAARLAPAGQVGAITGGIQFMTFLGALATPPLFGFVVGLAGGYGKAYLVFCLLPGLTGAYLLARLRRRPPV
ncbi:MAG: MFS transporter [Betaproteobacteria bacterium]|nr:MFS transporter [Betaproteobacteria bacterium]